MGGAVDLDEGYGAVGGVRGEALDDALLEGFREISEVEPVVVAESGEGGFDEFLGERAAIGAVGPLQIDGELVTELGEVDPANRDEQPVVKMSGADAVAGVFGGEVGEVSS